MEKPQVVLEVAGRHVESEVLASYQESPNFTELVQHVTVGGEGTVGQWEERDRVCPACDSGKSGQDMAYKEEERRRQRTVNSSCVG